MEAFGDQLSSIELLEMNERRVDINANDGKPVTQDLNDVEVKQILDEIKDKFEQTVSLEQKTAQDNEEIKLNGQLLRQTDSDADLDVNKEQTKSSDIVVNDKDTNEKSDEADPNVKESDRLVSNSAITSKLTHLKTMTEKWGESVGVCDEKGVPKRVLNLNEINNYLKLELNSIKSDFGYYLSLINDRYPRFYDSTIDYFQRWRMRYNVFVDNVFESPKSESLLHMGEIHLYFDLIPRSSQPFYVNNSFYRNTLPPEISVDGECIQRIVKTLDSIRFGKDIFQLKFPIRSDLFNNCNQVFDKFMERQTEFVEEAQTVHRKNEQKRRYNSGRRSRFQTNQGFRGYSRNDRNERDFGRNNREFGGNDRNERDFGRNERGFGRSNRGFDGKKREFGRNRNVRDKNVDKGLDCEVTFEDTRERRESDASKWTNNRARGFKRFNHKGMDDKKDSRSGPNFGNNERNKYRSDSTGRQFDENRRRTGSFRGKERFSTGFKINDGNDSHYNRSKQTGGESSSETNSRSNSFGNSYRPNRRSSFGRLEFN